MISVGLNMLIYCRFSVIVPHKAAIINAFTPKRYIFFYEWQVKPVTDKQLPLPKRLLYILAAAGAAFVFFKYLLPLLLPFLLAFFIAMLLERPILVLTEKFRIKRGFASVFTVTLFVSAFFGLIIFICTQAADAASSFMHSVPTRLSGFSLPIGGLGIRLERFIASLPEDISGVCSSALESVRAQISLLPEKAYARLFDIFSSAAAKAPDIVFFSFVLTLGLYFISAGFPSVKLFLLRQLPARLKVNAGTVRGDVLGTVKSWLSAQLKLMGITFLELSAAFFIMRLNFAPLLAAIISLIDALPVFGIGTVLIPWALFSLISGAYRRAVMLLALYAVVSLVRSILEPKLLGSQCGLHPAATLLAIYSGYRLFGVSGMIFFPIGLMLLKQFNDRGWIRLWK